MTKQAHYVRLTFHSAERLKDLLKLENFVEASKEADRLYLEAKRDVPAKDNAWWYVHDEAILCVGFPQGVPTLFTVCPPTWTLTKDTRGGEWYWCVGPADHRNSKAKASLTT